MISAAIIGRLTRDPEQRQAGQSIVVNFTVASDGSRQDQDATFVRVAVWGKRGDFVTKYFHRGDPIFVSGELATSTYTTRGGEDRMQVELNASTVSFVPRPPKSGNDQAMVGDDGLSEDDMPF